VKHNHADSHKGTKPQSSLERESSDLSRSRSILSEVTAFYFVALCLRARLLFCFKGQTNKRFPAEKIPTSKNSLERESPHLSRSRSILNEVKAFCFVALCLRARLLFSCGTGSLGIAFVFCLSAAFPLCSPVADWVGFVDECQS